MKTTSGGRGGKRNLAQLGKKGNPMEMGIDRKEETKTDLKIETKSETEISSTGGSTNQKVSNETVSGQNLTTSSVDGGKSSDRKSSSSNLFGALANAPLFAMGTSSNNNSSSGNNNASNAISPTTTATTTVSSASKIHNSVSVATAGLTTVVSTVSSTSMTTSSSSVVSQAGAATFSHSYESFLTESLKRATREPLSPEMQAMGPRKRSK